MPHAAALVEQFNDEDGPPNPFHEESSAGEVLAAPARDVELSAYDLPRLAQCDVSSGDAPPIPLAQLDANMCTREKIRSILSADTYCEDDQRIVDEIHYGPVDTDAFVDDFTMGESVVVDDDESTRVVYHGNTESNRSQSHPPHLPMLLSLRPNMSTSKILLIPCDV